MYLAPTDPGTAVLTQVSTPKFDPTPPGTAGQLYDRLYGRPRSGQQYSMQHGNEWGWGWNLAQPPDLAEPSLGTSQQEDRGGGRPVGGETPDQQGRVLSAGAKRP